MSQRRRRAATSPTSLWQPDPQNHPQQLAYLSTVKWLGYGGAAGGGKTDLAIGKLLTRHHRSIIFRREYPQLKDIMNRAEELAGSVGLNRNDKVYKFAPGRALEFGALQYEADKRKYKGRPHDGIAFDEANEFARSQIQYVSIWNRTTVVNQICQIILTFNPPDDPEGEWIIDFFAPWIDEEYSGPGGKAQPGEVRWAVVLEQPGGGYKDIWTASPEPVEIDGKTYIPESRTFIPARVEDNPHLMATGYDKQLDALPDELRDMMRHGIMRRNLKDNALQVIPREWIFQAQQRWEQFHADGGKLEVPLSQTGADVSRGGADRTVIVNRYGNYFAQPVVHQGVDTDDGPKVAALILRENDGKALVSVDVIGVGSSVYDSLKLNHDSVVGLNSAEPSKARDRSQKMKFFNKRSEWHWKMREALDPVHGENLMIPPGADIRRQACAARYKVTVRGLQVEKKDDIKARIGGESPDHWEAILYAYASSETSFRLDFA